MADALTVLNILKDWVPMAFGAGALWVSLRKSRTEERVSSVDIGGKIVKNADESIDLWREAKDQQVAAIQADNARREADATRREASLMERIAFLECAQADYARDKAAWEKERAEMRERISYLERLEVAKSSEMIRMQAFYEATTTKLAQTHVRELNAAAADIDRLHTLLEAAGVKLGAAEVKLEAAEIKIAAMQEEIDELREELVAQKARTG